MTVRRRRAGHGATTLASLLATAMLPAAAHASRVVIKRDSYGVPHIYANDVGSLFYGYGYAVAEDRLYQMEIVKRSAEGTVAEVSGSRYLATDEATRANLDPASLRRQLAKLSPADRAMFDGYAAGFNARIAEVMAHKSTLMPKEFIDNGFEPTRWTPYDIAAVWVGLILNRFFSGNRELANLHLLNELRAAKGDAVGTRIYRQLRWLDDPTAPTIQAQDRTARPVGQPVRGLAAYLAPLSASTAAVFQAAQVASIGPEAANGMPTASNAWVVAPSHSTAHHAVLENGPQQGWFSPSIVYSVGLHGAGFDITGATPVALPAIFFGTNGKIAWGSTVGALDTNDLYQEHLDPADSHRYRFDGAFRAMTVRREMIHVRGDADRTIKVYSTVHGPVDAWDIKHGVAYALKRSWQGHEIETLLGWAHVGQARNWAGFLAQAKRVAASITWFYADVGGHIGYAGLGLLPDRPANQQIQFPADGDGSMEWRGTLPFSANPRQLDPAQGFLVSWNNKTMPGLMADGADYSHVDRVNELAAALTAKARLSDAELWEVDRRGAQADLNHRYFAPVIAAAVADLPATDPLRRAGTIAADWDGQLVDGDRDGRYDGAGPVIFRTWLSMMLRDLLQPELPADIYKQFADDGYPAPYSPSSAKPGIGAKLLWNALQHGRDGAPFSYDFFQGRNPAAMVRKALAETVAALDKAQGSDMTRWRLSATPMRFAVETPLGVPWASPGEAHDLAHYRNRGSISFQVRLDPGKVTMCSAAAPGESGFVSPSGRVDRHYADQLPLFRDFRCKPDAVGSAAIDAVTTRTEVLDAP